MIFWILAIAIFTISAAVISWPLLAGKSKERFLGLAILLSIPLAGLLLYQQVGTPDALSMKNLNAANPGDANQTTATNESDELSMDQLIARLKQNLEENPDNPEGWMMLGRTLKSMQQYPEALSAIEKADKLLPGSPVIMVELAEAQLFASGNPIMDGDIYQLLTDAVSMDPQQQKGLWLLGMAESQAGNYKTAIGYWTTLQGMLDPSSGAAQTVAQQIETAKGQTSGEVTTGEVGVADENPENQVATASAIPVDLSLNDSLPPAPASSVLFVFVHPAGQRGMPLAVKRISGPVFPLSISLSDADTLRPGSSLAEHKQLDISARVSLTGVANAASGDYQANVVTVDSDSTTSIVLTFDQSVP